MRQLWGYFWTCEITAKVEAAVFLSLFGGEWIQSHHPGLLPSTILFLLPFSDPVVSNTGREWRLRK